MKVRIPTEYWRNRKAEERQRFLAGKIAAKDCFMEQLFPDEFIERTDALLKEFISSISTFSSTEADYSRVMAAIQLLVIELNKINDDFDGSVIETGEREELCEFIDNVIIERGIDIEALAASQDCDRNELTDEWRDW
jgi:hypothetical protein